MNKGVIILGTGSTRVQCPQIGDTVSGRSLGYKNANRLMWWACPICKKEKWKKTRLGEVVHPRCRDCARHETIKDKHPNWNGGRSVHGQGYIEIRVYPDDFFFTMADKRGYVFEHRLVIAKSIGRCLRLWELVHHKNHIRDDNRIENLQLMSGTNHFQITILESKIERQRKEIEDLKCKLKERL